MKPISPVVLVAIPLNAILQSVLCALVVQGTIMWSAFQNLGFAARKQNGHGSADGNAENIIFRKQPGVAAIEAQNSPQILFDHQKGQISGRGRR